MSNVKEEKRLCGVKNLKKLVLVLVLLVLIRTLRVYVYHWSMEEDKKPEKKFDLQNDKRQIKKIGYNACRDGNFFTRNSQG